MPRQPLTDMPGLHQMVTKEGGLVAHVQDRLKPENTSFFSHILPLTPGQWAASPMAEKVRKHCFRLVNGFPGNISTLRKPKGRDYSSGKTGLETDQKRTIQARSLDLARDAGSLTARAKVG